MKSSFHISIQQPPITVVTRLLPPRDTESLASKNIVPAFPLPKVLELS
ncbi:MAG: hypothetical protein AAF316_12045 [Cyanobacteria bacterium P01_A01_bin.80]